MGHMGFETTLVKYCTSCHAADTVTLAVDIRDVWWQNNKTFKADMCKSNDCTKLDVKCEHCGSMHTILLDEKMGKIVPALNLKGYQTEFSCDGYKGKDKISYPYLVFNGNTTPIDIFNTMPGGWELVVNADFNAAHKICNPAMYYRWSTGNTDIDWDLDEMTEWIDKLPFNDINPMKIIKKPGERYLVDDIKKVLDDIGCSVIDTKIMAYKDKKNKHGYAVIVEFGNGIPDISVPMGIDGGSNSIVFILDRLSSDSILEVINAICKDYMS